MKTKPQTIKFWVYLNGSPVRIKLRPGQSLTYRRWEPTDEGWSSEQQTWEHAGHGVFRHCISDGRDCDGRLTEYATDKTTLSQLARIIDHEGFQWENKVIRYPRWKTVTASQRDEYAEAMGY